MIAEPESGGLDAALEGQPLAEINVTPLVDVMLVLLVIFMATAPLMVQGLPLDLPQTAAARQQRPTRPLVVSLARGGEVSIGSDRIPAAELSRRLAELRRTAGDSAVYLRADRALSYGEIAHILGLISASGFSRVSLLTAARPTPSTGEE